MKGYKKIMCENCGQYDVVPSPRRYSYCDREECQEAMKKRIENDKNNISEHIFSKEIKNIEVIKKVKIEDILGIAQQLGDLRKELIDMIQIENEEIKKANSQDITLLHLIEFEDLTKEEVYDVFIKEKERRENRRQNKYRYKIIKMLLDSINIKRPAAAIRMVVQGMETEKDINKIISDVTKDPAMFAQSKEENE